MLNFGLMEVPPTCIQDGIPNFKCERASDCDLRDQRMNAASPVKEIAPRPCRESSIQATTIHQYPKL
jgi:hypothetical protein